MYTHLYITRHIPFLACNQTASFSILPKLKPLRQVQNAEAAEQLGDAQAPDGGGGRRRGVEAGEGAGRPDVGKGAVRTPHTTAHRPLLPPPLPPLPRPLSFWYVLSLTAYV